MTTVLERAVLLMKILMLASVSWVAIILALAILQVKPIITQTEALLATAQKTMLLTNKAVNDTRLTLDNVNKAAIDERFYLEKNLPVIAAKMNLVIDNSNALLISLKHTSDVTAAGGQDVMEQASLAINSLDVSVKQLTPIETNAASAVIELQTATTSLNAVLSNPDLKSSLANTAHGTKTVDGMVDDTAATWHKFLHPSWPHKVYSFVTGIGIDAGRIFF